MTNAHTQIEMKDVCFAERALLQYTFTSSLCLETWFGFLKTFLGKAFGRTSHFYSKKPLSCVL